MFYILEIKLLDSDTTLKYLYDDLDLAFEQGELMREQDATTGYSVLEVDIQSGPIVMTTTKGVPYVKEVTLFSFNQPSKPNLGMDICDLLNKAKNLKIKTLDDVIEDNIVMMKQNAMMM